MTEKRTVRAVPRLRGAVTPPADKSISHRAVMLGSLAKGDTVVHNFLQSEDCLATAGAFKNMGIEIQETGKNILRVKGKGIMGLQAPRQDLYVANSGTTMRLLLGILAGQPFSAVLSGDPSLSKRPMRRVTDPLREMGAQISGNDNANYAPLTISGGQLKGISFANRLRSAQVKSALLLAGMYAQGVTEVTEETVSRDHMERMLKLFGANFTQEGHKSVMRKTEQLHACEITVPGDISSAAFFMIAASLVPGSEVILRGVGLNPTRTGLLEVLKQMGADFSIENYREAWEPTGDILVRYAPLKAVQIGKEQIPSLIDELPVLMVAFALAEGVSEIRGAEELRVKETDRIKTMCANLSLLGVTVEELPDGCIITGRKDLNQAIVDSYGDHRNAMAMAVAGLRARGPVEILDSACVAVSYPGFFQDLERISR